MEEAQYERVVVKTINNGPYVELEHDPLQDMVKAVDEVLEDTKTFYAKTQEKNCDNGN